MEPCQYREDCACEACTKVRDKGEQAKWMPKPEPFRISADLSQKARECLDNVYAAKGAGEVVHIRFEGSAL